jgi:hypothetical protein
VNENKKQFLCRFLFESYTVLTITVIYYEKAAKNLAAFFVVYDHVLIQI